VGSVLYFSPEIRNCQYCRFCWFTSRCRERIRKLRLARNPAAVIPRISISHSHFWHCTVHKHCIASCDAKKRVRSTHCSLCCARAPEATSTASTRDGNVQVSSGGFCDVSA